jgi:hypothetical protein
VVLVAIALLAALLFDAGVEELRAARSDLARVGAASLAEGALAALIEAPGDSALETLAVGGSQRTTVPAGGDSAELSVQPIGGSLLRVTVVAHVATGRSQTRQGALAFTRLTVDTMDGVRTLRLRPLAGWWRSPLP